MYCYNRIFFFDILSFFFCTFLFTKHFVLLQKQQEPKQVSFLSAICHWLFVKSFLLPILLKGVMIEILALWLNVHMLFFDTVVPFGQNSMHFFSNLYRLGIQVTQFSRQIWHWKSVLTYPSSQYFLHVPVYGLNKSNVLSQDKHDVSRVSLQFKQDGWQYMHSYKVLLRKFVKISIYTTFSASNQAFLPNFYPQLMILYLFPQNLTHIEPNYKRVITANANGTF